jgi:hypothetical protein
LDPQRLGEPLDPLVRVANGLPIFGEGNGLRRMLDSLENAERRLLTVEVDRRLE